MLKCCVKKQIIVIIVVFLLKFGCHSATPQLFEGSECELYDGTLGICKSLLQCQWAINNYKNGKITLSDIRRTTCSYVGSNEIVCCGDERPTKHTTETPPFIDRDNDDDIYFFDNSNRPVKPTRKNNGRQLPFNNTDATKKPINSFWSQWSPLNNVSLSNNNRNSSKLNAKLILEQSNMVIGDGNILNSLAQTVNISSSKSNDNDLFPSVIRTTTPNSIITPTTNTITSTSSTTTTTTTTSSSHIPPRIHTRKSERACAEYTKLSNPFLSFQILGGIPTGLGEFPHMAALGYPSQDQPDYEYEFDCGGSIISDIYILTAAHCVTSRNTPVVVRMGKISLHTNDDGTDGITSNIAEIISHPSYRRSQRYNDIALIRLSTPIPFSETIRPACLRTNISDVDPGVELIVTGWGATSIERAQRSKVLLKANLTSVSLESCNASLLEYNSNDRSLRNGVVLSQMCAYDPEARRDACQGDSGGPLQIYNSNGVSTIAGITSFGISCGSLLPSVYTRVAFYLDWIESIVWPN